jgi:hypothetical protein
MASHSAISFFIFTKPREPEKLQIKLPDLRSLLSLCTVMEGCRPNRPVVPPNWPAIRELTFHLDMLPTTSCNWLATRFVGRWIDKVSSPDTYPAIIGTRAVVSGRDSRSCIPLPRLSFAVLQKSHCGETQPSQIAVSGGSLMSATGRLLASEFAERPLCAKCGHRENAGFDPLGLHRRLAWLACGTPRLSDMWECTHNQPSAFPENTRVARPGRGNGWPSG